MSYRQIEDLSNRSQERVALFITLDNVFGMLAVALPVFLCTSLMPAGVGIVLVFLAAIAGFLLTVPVAGMPVYQRLMWRVRGGMRRRIQGPERLPAQLAGRRTTVASRSARVDSPVQQLPDAVAAEWLRTARQE